MEDEVEVIDREYHSIAHGKLIFLPRLAGETGTCLWAMWLLSGGLGDYCLQRWPQPGRFMMKFLGLLPRFALSVRLEVII